MTYYWLITYPLLHIKFEREESLCSTHMVDRLCWKYKEVDNTWPMDLSVRSDVKIGWSFYESSNMHFGRLCVVTIDCKVSMTSSTTRWSGSCLFQKTVGFDRMHICIMWSSSRSVANCLDPSCSWLDCAARNMSTTLSANGPSSVLPWHHSPKWVLVSIRLLCGWFMLSRKSIVCSRIFQ